MNPNRAANDVEQLSAHEVCAVSQRMSIDPTSPGEYPSSILRSNSASGISASRTGLFFLVDVLTLHALLTLAAALLDMEGLKSGIGLQIQHYSIAYFWLNLSMAMALVAGCVMENIRWRPSEILGFQ